MTITPTTDEQLAALVEAVCASTKYRSVCPELIASIGKQELGKRRSLKEAIKATKNRLHQVGGAYLDAREPYAIWLRQLQEAAQVGDQLRLLDVCRAIMSHHASTRERLPILERFYAEIFAALPPVRSVLDIACGLHPLAIPWMPLAEGTMYYSYDIYQDMTDFLQAWLNMLPLHGQSQAIDVLQSCPAQRVDVAFLLKAIPCLEQIDPAAGRHLLQSIQADFLVVSFPAHSLGGRKKGMIAHYETQFHALLADQYQWHIIKRWECESELVFVLKEFQRGIMFPSDVRGLPRFT